MRDYQRDGIPPRKTVRSNFSSVAPRDPSVTLKMLAHVHTYPPHHNNGASLTMHEFLKAGVRVKGWAVQLITDYPPTRNDQWEGIPVRHDRNVRRLSIDYQFSNVAITHLDATPKAMELSARMHTPLVHLVHNMKQLEFFAVQPRLCALAIFNSFWLADAVKWTGPQVVMHPPFDPARFTSSAGDAILLVNLTDNKGAPLFYALADANPQYRFIGLKGGYGPQVAHPALPNLEIRENTPDINSVLAETRLLLAPSRHESWGRTVIEAACAGIPSIATPALGMIESGIPDLFLDRADFDGWESNVHRLMDNEEEWGQASQSAMEKVKSLHATTQAELDQALALVDALS